MSYTDHRVDLYNSGVNQLLGLAAVRGYRLCHFRMADLYRHDDRPMVRATILAVDPEWSGDEPLDAWQHVRPVGTENLDVADIGLYFVRGDDIRRTDTPNIDVLRAAETEAVVIESVAATLATCDKYEMVVRCPEVPQPLTFAATELEPALEAVDRLPLEDGWFVLKDRFGYGCGAQVHRLHRDTPHLDHLIGDYLQAYGDILLQEYRAEVADGDLVVTFVDDELIGTMRRLPAEGEWKTNASLGAEQVRHELTPEQEDAARAARRAFAECRVASVDLVLSGRVLEINAFPGGEGLLETHGVVLAERVLDRLEVELGVRDDDRDVRAEVRAGDTDHDEDDDEQEAER